MYTKLKAIGRKPETNKKDSSKKMKLTHLFHRITCISAINRLLSALADLL